MIIEALILPEGGPWYKEVLQEPFTHDFINMFDKVSKIAKEEGIEKVSFPTTNTQCKLVGDQWFAIRPMKNKLHTYERQKLTYRRRLDSAYFKLQTGKPEISQ